MRPVIALTTDFGLADHYVGTMKGVLLSRCPTAQLVDVSHEIPAFSIEAGAYAIDQAAPYFPAGTVHLIVIDPGVGTARRPLVASALGQYFVAPDNGVLSMIVERDKDVEAYEITNRNLFLEAPSSTFHGRDIFAPVAAALAAGAVNPEDVGPQIERIELLRGLRPEQIAPGVWVGKVLSVDRFGNAITNFRTVEFPNIVSGVFRLNIGEQRVAEYRRAFGEAPEGLCFAYSGSSGHIEIGMNRESASKRLGIAPGDRIELQL